MKSNNRYLGALMIAPFIIFVFLGGMPLKLFTFVLSLLGMFEFYKATRIKHFKPISILGYIAIILYYTFNNDLLLNPKMRTQFESDLTSIKNDFGPFSIGYNKNLNEEYGSDYSKYGLIHKSNIGEILTFNINEGIKFNAQALKDTVKELNAGRNDPEHISELTINLQYLLSRLSYGVEDEGFGLSSRDTGSPLETAKNIALKRMLPIAALYQGFNVLNYESQKLTGTSIPGAFANSLAVSFKLNFISILPSTII